MFQLGLSCLKWLVVSSHLSFVRSGLPLKQKKGFVEKLVQRIVDNIEIKVTDVHIRYSRRSFDHATRTVVVLCDFRL